MRNEGLKIINLVKEYFFSEIIILLTHLRKSLTNNGTGRLVHVGHIVI